MKGFPLLWILVLGQNFLINAEEVAAGQNVAEFITLISDFFKNAETDAAPPPLLSEVPETTSFSCDGQIPGFYADVESQCQVFHMCTPQGYTHSFLCANGTTFNQRLLTCDWWFRSVCEDAPNFYRVNEELYRETSDYESDADLEDTQKQGRNLKNISPLLSLFVSAEPPNRGKTLFNQDQLKTQNQFRDNSFDVADESRDQSVNFGYFSPNQAEERPFNDYLPPNLEEEQTVDEYLQPNREVEQTVGEYLPPNREVEQTVDEYLQPNREVEQTADEYLPPNREVVQTVDEYLPPNREVEQTVDEYLPPNREVEQTVDEYLPPNQEVEQTVDEYLPPNREEEQTVGEYLPPNREEEQTINEYLPPNREEEQTVDEYLPPNGYLPPAGNGYLPPAVGNGYLPPSGNGYLPPAVDNGYLPPRKNGHLRPFGTFNFGNNANEALTQFSFGVPAKKINLPSF